MEIINCKKCGRMFSHIGGQPICPNCKKELEDKFLEVKKYIRENPQANINQISQEMDVSISQINKWVREERLSFTENSVVTLECENCGARILTGRFCGNCKSAMINRLDEALPKKKKPEPTVKKKEEARMRFLDHR